MAQILIIDDEPVIVEILTEVLLDEGFEITSAYSGIAGLDILRQGFMPELILIDLFMPGIGGKDFIKILRSEKGLEDIPVILLTGAMPSTIDSSLNADYQEIVYKPFDIMEVVEKVNHLIESIHQRKALDSRTSQT